MNREQLINAIDDNRDSWSCPEYNCDKPEEKGNTGECCHKCAERQLAEYEKQIRAELLEEICNKIDEGVCNICEHKDFESKCYKECNHELETLKSWLEKHKMTESLNDRNFESWLEVHDQKKTREATDWCRALIKVFTKDWNSQSNKRIPYKAMDELDEFILQRRQAEEQKK